MHIGMSLTMADLLQYCNCKEKELGQFHRGETLKEKLPELISSHKKNPENVAAPECTGIESPKILANAPFYVHNTHHRVLW